MLVQNIETADCNILNTKISSNEIRIYFESVYDIDKKQYIDNMSLVILNWSNFEAKIFISNGFGEIPEEKKLSIYDLEFFEYIQTISVNGGKITLRGYSKDSGYWLEYHFSNSEFYLKEF